MAPDACNVRSVATDPSGFTLAAALVADGCPAQWLVTATARPGVDAPAEVNRLADLGFVRLVLSEAGVTVRVREQVRDLSGHRLLGPVVRAWAALHRAAHEPQPRPLPAHPPRGAAAAVVPLPLGDDLLIRQAMAERPPTTLAGVGSDGGFELPRTLGHARWVPFPAPLVLAWRGRLAVYQPVESHRRATADPQLVDDLAGFAEALHRFSIGLETITLLHVVQQLREGVTDTHAARRLGMSERHYRRHVASVMQTVSASSRWQAAARIEAGQWPYRAPLSAT